MYNLGDCLGTQNEHARLAMVRVGINIGTVMKATGVRVGGEGVLENLSLRLIRARNFSYPRLEKLYDFPMPTYRSDQEWCLPPAIWPVGIDIVPCEQ